VSRIRQRGGRRRSLELGERPAATRVVFMSVFDCHVNRSPLAGKIEAHGSITWRLLKRRHFDKAERGNDSQLPSSIAGAGSQSAWFRSRADRAPECLFRARGASVGARGERIGMIRFGSRVSLPAQARGAAHRRDETSDRG